MRLKVYHIFFIIYYLDISIPTAPKIATGISWTMESPTVVFRDAKVSGEGKDIGVWNNI